MTNGRLAACSKPSWPEAGPLLHTTHERTAPMDYQPTEPIFAKPLVLADSDQTDASTCSSPPKRKSVPASIRSLISGLGLRYAPSAAADLEAHAARVALLAEDLADAEPWKLQQAIAQHVNASPYLPKASDLRELMRDIGRRPGDEECVDVVGFRNAELEAKGSPLRWAWNNPSDRAAGTHLTTLTPLSRNESLFA